MKFQKEIGRITLVLFFVVIATACNKDDQVKKR